MWPFRKQQPKRGLREGLKFSLGEPSTFNPDLSFWGNIVGLDRPEFWQRKNYAIGYPLAATEPEGHFVQAYRDALRLAPSEQARNKVIEDNKDLAQRWVN